MTGIQIGFSCSVFSSFPQRNAIWSEQLRQLLTWRRLLAATTVICLHFTSIIILRAAFPVWWTWVVFIGTSSNRPIAYILRRMRWLCRGFRCRFCSCFRKNKWNENNQIKKIRHVSFQLQWNILWLVSIAYLVEESCGSSSSDLF